jgi:hypothetical protein
METQKISVERYVLDSLMVDLVGHDRRPSAYILYLALLRLGAARKEIGISLQGLATATGLSKTAVQRSVAHLMRRELISMRAAGRTQAPYYRVRQPWQRSRGRK